MHKIWNILKIMSLWRNIPLFLGHHDHPSGQYRSVPGHHHARPNTLFDAHAIAAIKHVLVCVRYTAIWRPVQNHWRILDTHHPDYLYGLVYVCGYASREFVGIPSEIRFDNQCLEFLSKYKIKRYGSLCFHFVLNSYILMYNFSCLFNINNVEIRSLLF